MHDHGQQVRSEGEKRGKWEDHSEEAYETELDDHLVVQVDESRFSWLHGNLSFDVHVELDARLPLATLCLVCLLQFRLKLGIDFLQLAIVAHSCVAVHSSNQEDLLKDHDQNKVGQQLLRILQVEDADKVGCVVIAELKDIGLVDQ